MPSRARRYIGRQVMSCAVEHDRPVVRLHQAGDHVEAGGLAGAVRAEQPDRLAALQVDRDVPHHRPLAVALAEADGDQAALAGAAIAASARAAWLRRSRSSARSSPSWRPGCRLRRAGAGGLSAAPSCWFGTISPCTRAPGAETSRATPVLHVHDGFLPVELVVAAGDADIAEQPGHAGLRRCRRRDRRARPRSRCGSRHCRRPRPGRCCAGAGRLALHRRRRRAARRRRRRGLGRRRPRGNRRPACRRRRGGSRPRRSPRRRRAPPPCASATSIPGCPAR